jgi:hypothetical protein
LALNLAVDFNQGIAMPVATDRLIPGIDGRVTAAAVATGKENGITAPNGVNDQEKRHQGSQQKGSNERQDGDGNGIIGRKAENDPLNESSEGGEKRQKVLERDGQKIGSRLLKEKKSLESEKEEEEHSERISDTKSMKIDMSLDSSSAGQKQQQQRPGLHAGQTSIHDPDIRVGRGEDGDEEGEEGGGKKRRAWNLKKKKKNTLRESVTQSQ